MTKLLGGINNIFVSIFLFQSAAVLAWDGNATGKIARVDVTGGENYGFRIYLEGSPPLCSNGHNWAYINLSHSNYKTYVASLLAAKAVGDDVTIYTNNDANIGYCRIGYISVR